MKSEDEQVQMMKLYLLMR